MDIIFLRTGLEQYKTSKNIFKRLYFYIKIYLLKHNLLVKVINDYDFYDLIVQYIELIDSLSRKNIINEIVENVDSFGIAHKDVQVVNALTFKLLNFTAVESYNNSQISICTISDLERTLDVQYKFTDSRNSEDETFYHLTVDDNNQYINVTIVDGVRQDIIFNTRMFILKSIWQIIDGM